MPTITLCACGCGKPVKIAPWNNAEYGHVKGQPRKFLQGHNRRRSLEDSYVVTESGCWEWRSPRDSKGYGRITRDGKKWLAHRFFYVHAKGEIAAGLQLDHLCRNPPCVNPDHLEPVTNAENQRRSPTVRLTMEIAQEIRESSLGVSEAARFYGVPPSHISNIRSGKSWVAQ